jgi:hypothetical protein
MLAILKTNTDVIASDPAKAGECGNCILTIICAAILCCLINIELGAAVKKRPVRGDFFWHWHRKTHLDKAGISKIIGWNFKGIFLQAGEFSYYNNSPQFNGLVFQADTFERLSALNDLQLHLVYTFSAASKFNFVKYFNNDTNTAINYILRTIDSDLNIFKCRKLKVDGIQLDMEGRQLNISKYKKLIDAVAKKFGKKHLISITPEVSLSLLKRFSILIKNVDFFVPMIYDYAVGKNVNHPLKVTDTRWINSTVKKYRNLHKPFYAGIPSYSYSKIYDEKGNLVDPWAGVSLEGLSENPDFKLIKSRRNTFGKAKKYNGDNIYLFKALRDTELANYDLKKGAAVKFDMLTPQGVKEYISTVKKIKQKNLLGVAVFRYGYKWNRLIVGEDDMGKIYGKTPSKTYPAPEILFDEKKNKGLTKGGYIKINLVLTNRGNQESYTSKSANSLYLEVKNGKIIKFSRGGFDSAVKNINSLTLNERHLAKNEAVYSGTIQIRADKLPLILHVRANSVQIDGKSQIQSKRKLMSISSRKVKRLTRDK